MFPLETFYVTIGNMNANTSSLQNLDSALSESPAVRPVEEAARPPRRPSLRERAEFLAIRSAFRAGSLLAPGLTAERALRYFMEPTRIPRPGWEQELAGSARRQVLRTGVVAYSWGQGPKVLLIHGWDGRGTQMGRIAQAFVEAGYEAVALDLPGHGESPGTFAHVPLAMEAIVAAGEEIGEFEAVVGHSFGAAASLYAVYQGLSAKKVVYVAGPNRFTDLFDRYCAWVGVTGSARLHFHEKAAKFVDIDPVENFPGNWAAKIDQPGLVVHDRNDEDVPFTDAEALQFAWKKSRFLITARLGHRRVLKSKEVIAAIVDFVRK